MEKIIFIVRVLLSCLIFSNEINHEDGNFIETYKKDIIDSIYHKQANTYYLDGNYEEAKKYYKLSIENEEKVSNSYNNLAGIYISNFKIEIIICLNKFVVKIKYKKN